MSEQMELRWLEGDWEHGKFKLQFKRTGYCDWTDVPRVKEESEIPEDSGIELIKRIKTFFGFDLSEAKQWYDNMRFWSERKAERQNRKDKS